MKTAETIRERLSDANIKGSVLDLAEEKETTRLFVRVIDVFSYGFIILVSLIAVGSVFAVVFLSMCYAAGKIRKDNLIDALKNEIQ